jgi:hypothetical protein
MKVKQIFTLMFAMSWLFFSCDKKNECDNRNGNYSQGVFVVNEGPFGGSGSITWHNPATGETVEDVYAAENCGATLGQFVQSLTFHNGRGYIVVNGANKIVMVDANSFQYIGVIEGLALPRFFMPIDDEFAYVSQWGSDGLNGSVAKVSLTTKQVVKTIPVGSGAEKMVLANDLLFVSNAGGYGLDSTVAVVRVSDDQLLSKYTTTGKNPSSLLLEPGATPQVVYLCKGYYLESSPAGNLNVTNGLGAGYTLPPYSDDLVRDDTGQFFFTTNTQVYAGTGAAGNYSLAPVFDQNTYGLGIDPIQNLLYCADAKDFSSAGEVVVRRYDGSIVGRFNTGIAPGEIVVR